MLFVSGFLQVAPLEMKVSLCKKLYINNKILYMQKVLDYLHNICYYYVTSFAGLFFCANFALPAL